MRLLEYFKRPQKTAVIAKDRLQIIVARERAVSRNGPDYLPQLQQELLQVMAKYEHIDLDQVSVNVDRRSGSEVLEINVVLSDKRPKDPENAVALAFHRTQRGAR